MGQKETYVPLAVSVKEEREIGYTYVCVCVWGG